MQNPIKDIQNSNKNIKDNKDNKLWPPKTKQQWKQIGESLKPSDLPKGLGVTRLELYLGREPREV